MILACVCVCVRISVCVGVCARVSVCLCDVPFVCEMYLRENTNTHPRDPQVILCPMVRVSHNLK